MVPTAAPGHEADVEARDNWWHVVVATPPSTLSVEVFGEIGVLLLLPFWLLYPVAVWYDGAYVRAVTDGPTPKKRWTALAGVLNLVSLGFLTWLISPYYLYRRHGWVGVP